MNQIKQSLGGALLVVLEVIVGILLLINPSGFTTSIIIAAGILLMVAGVDNVIKYVRADAEEAAKTKLLMTGSIALTAGAFCAFNTQWFLTAFPVLTILYGIVILLTGFGKLQLTVDMLRQKNQDGFWV